MECVTTLTAEINRVSGTQQIICAFIFFTTPIFLLFANDYFKSIRNDNDSFQEKTEKDRALAMLNVSQQKEEESGEPKCEEE